MPSAGPSATFAPSPRSRLHISGDRIGDVSGIKSLCGQHQVVGNGYRTDYITVEGSLNGDLFHLDVYDPSSPGSWEGQFHIYVRISPPNRTGPSNDYYTWFTGSTSGISGFNATGGATLAANVPGRTSADSQAGGLVPNGPITVTGAIDC